MKCGNRGQYVQNPNSALSLKTNGDIVSYYAQIMSKQYGKNVIAVNPYFSAFSFTAPWTSAAWSTYNDLSNTLTQAIPTFANTKVFYAGKLDVGLTQTGAPALGTSYNISISIHLPFRNNLGAFSLAQLDFINWTSTAGLVPFQTATPGLTVFESGQASALPVWHTNGTKYFENVIFSGISTNGTSTGAFNIPAFITPVFLGYQILTD